MVHALGGSCDTREAIEQGRIENRSYHLSGFTAEQEAELYDRMTA